MVQEEPKTIDEFKELVEKRLKIKDLPMLSANDQEELVIKYCMFERDSGINLIQFYFR
jgi:hypothetical protein